MKIVTRRSDRGNGSGRRRIEFTTPKIARFAPRQIADRGKRGARERRRFVELAKGEAKIVGHEQTHSARKAVTCSNADIAVYVIDPVLELTLVLGAVETTL